jgi:outer membrane lipoprotein SlyB
MLISLLPQRTLGGRLAAVAASLVLLSGCISSSKNVYEGRDVGRMIDTTEATVVNSRIVNIKEESKGYGPLAGAALGGVGTGLASSGSHNAGWLIALGALAGAGIGYFAEQFARSRDGIEYTVRTSDGRGMTLVQNRDSEEAPIPAGKAVLVQHAGTYTRIIEKPDTLEDQWRNPDASGGGQGAGAQQQRGGGNAVPASQTPSGGAAPGSGSNGARPTVGGAPSGPDQ